jgi:transposase
MGMLAATIDGVIGVDTHRDTLTAAAVTAIGGLLGQATASTDAAGYQQLLAFASDQVPGRRCWAIEGAGSFGAGLAVFLADHGEQVVEVPAGGARPPLCGQERRAGRCLHRPGRAGPGPSGGVRRRGDREALRVLLATRRNAVNAGIQAVDQLKALIVSAPRSSGPSCAAAAPRPRSAPAPPFVGARPGPWSTR